MHQTFTDLQVIVVNDGSTDQSGRIAEEYAAMDRRVQVYHTANQGLAMARNYGLERADREYIGFVDSDDLVDPGSMIRSNQIINEKQPDILMFGMSFDYYSGKQLYQRLELYYDQERFLTSDELNAIFSELYHNNMLTPCWNKLFRRDLLLNYGTQFHTDMFVMEDFLFSLEALGK